MSRVVLFKGVSRYGATERYIEELAAGLRGEGREVVILDEADPRFAERLALELDFRCELAVGFDGTGMLHDGPDPFAHNAIPHLSLLREHPVRLWSHFHTHHMRWGCADRDAAGFVERAFAGRRALHFLPMGATPPEAPGPMERRGVLFAGSFEEPDGIMARWRRDFSMEMAELFQTMTSHAVYSPEKSVGEAVEEVLVANDFPTGEELLRHYLPSAYVEVDRAVRNYRRLFLLHALDQAGIEVDLYGAGWSAAGFRRHRDHGPLPYGELLPKLSEAAVVLDISGHLHDGPHERLLTAMAHGAAVVTGGNPWIEANFDTGRDLLTYRRDAPEQLPEALALVLEDPVRREAMAAHGRERVLSAHTWRHRARELLKIVPALRIAA